MRKSSLSWKQVVGLEPMTEEEFRAEVERRLDEAENGELIPAEKVFASLESRFSKSAGIPRHAY